MVSMISFLASLSASIWVGFEGDAHEVRASIKVIAEAIFKVLIFQKNWHCG
jgi:hypothetical protein